MGFNLNKGKFKINKGKIKLNVFKPCTNVNAITQTAGSNGGPLTSSTVFYGGVGTTNYSGFIKSASVSIYKIIGTISGPMYCKIYNTSGISGTNAIPTGAPLAISTSVDASQLGSSSSYITFMFNQKFIINNNSQYAVVVDMTNTNMDTSNYWGNGYNSGAITGFNSVQSSDGINWSSNVTNVQKFYLTVCSY